MIKLKAAMTSFCFWGSCISSQRFQVLTETDKSRKSEKLLVNIII
jgi:hypothetical protein